MRSEERSRIAYVVYNDVYRDSRVLKTADSAAAAGNDVRIFAFGGPLVNFPAGDEMLPSGAMIRRVPLFPDNVKVLTQLIEWRQRSLRAAAEGAQSAGGDVASRRPRVVENVTRRLSALVNAVVIALRERDFRRRVAREVRAWKPDLIHAHDANTLPVALSVLSIPFVYDAHELWEARNTQKSERVQRRERRMLSRATGLMSGSVTVSPGIQRWMTERYGLAEQPTLVRNIPLASATPPGRDAGRLRSMAGLADSDQVIVYVGRITTGRGIPETIEALTMLDDSVHLVVLGYGPDDFLASLRQLIAARGLGERVHFIGSVDSAAVPATIADADASIVYTQPINLSYRMSLPNKLFESIHAGQAIIASDLPDVVDLVQRYGVGRTFPAGDVEELARTIHEVLAAPDTFRAASRAASTELTWEGEMSRLGALYAKVTNGRVSLGASGVGDR